MQHFTIQGCTSCGSLRDVYDRVECTLVDMIKRKFTNLQYNTSLSFNQDLYNDLVRYKRVIGHRLYNPSYPCSSIDYQDLIAQAILRAYKAGDCSQCTSCFTGSSNDSSSTSSSSTSSSSTTIV